MTYTEIAKGHKHKLPNGKKRIIRKKPKPDTEPKPDKEPPRPKRKIVKKKIVVEKGKKKIVKKTIKNNIDKSHNTPKKKILLKKVVDFYEKTGYTRPENLPPPPKWLLEGKQPPKNTRINIKIRKVLAEPKADVEPSKSEEPKKLKLLAEELKE